MTKQQPCASKLRLSKICRWLIVLGIAKLALFGAWSVDLPLPPLFSGEESQPASSAPAGSPARPPADRDGKAPVQAGGEVRLAALFAERAVSREATPTEAARPVEHAPPASSSAQEPPTPGDARPAPAAADDAAVRSAAPLPSMPVALLPWSRELRVEAASASSADNRPLASGVDADDAAVPAVRDAADTWWHGIMGLTRHLPVPMLGERQVAYAAAMDMPAPSRPSAPGASPFAPPEQARVQSPAPSPAGQTSDGAPLPLRARSSQGGAMAPAPQAGTSAPGALSTRSLPTPNAKPALSPDSPERMQQDLARREQEVLMLKQQMESRLQELQSTEKKVQGMLKEAHGVHDQKIKHLITAYTNMKPKQAALALESLDERLAVRILAGMNPKQAGEMLTYTNPQTVAKLSELMTRMQLPGE